MEAVHSLTHKSYHGQMLGHIQALRAVAALIVVCIHMPAAFDKLGFPYPTGGVELFFVISGFVMVHITTCRHARPLEFLRDRVRRIVPFYSLFTVAAFAVSVAVPDLTGSDNPSIADLLRSLGFVPYHREPLHLIRPVLFVGWTLNLEMFFYLIFAAALAQANPRPSWRSRP